MSAHLVLAKPWFRSKSIWLNALSSLAAGTALLAQELPDFKAKIPVGLYLAAGAVLAALNVWLRCATAAPIRGSSIHDAGDEIGHPACKKVL